MKEKCDKCKKVITHSLQGYSCEEYLPEKNQIRIFAICEKCYYLPENKIECKRCSKILNKYNGVHTCSPTKSGEV